MLDDSSSAPTCVLNIRLKARGSVSVPGLRGRRADDLLAVGRRQFEVGDDRRLGQVLDLDGDGPLARQLRDPLLEPVLRVVGRARR